MYIYFRRWWCFLGFKEINMYNSFYSEIQLHSSSTINKEVEWLRNMLLDIKLWPQLISSIYLHYNSQTTMFKAFSTIYNEKSRHISLRHEYLRKLFSYKIITIEYIRSCNNLVDPLTKGLSKDLVRSTSTNMGLRPFN